MPAIWRSRTRASSAERGECSREEERRIQRGRAQPLLECRHRAAVGREAEDVHHAEERQVHLAGKVRAGERDFAEAEEHQLHRAAATASAPYARWKIATPGEKQRNSIGASSTKSGTIAQTTIHLRVAVRYSRDRVDLGELEGPVGAQLGGEVEGRAQRRDQHEREREREAQQPGGSGGQRR